MNAYPWPDYDDRAHKYLSAQRLDYFDQSRRTTGGVVATFIPSAAPSLAAQPAPAGSPQAGTYTTAQEPAP